ncbi:hypothetical protein LTR36_000939 [Oleoguttula mirabilis]|uniref:Zn(2)-C6 fungal-type domain-containing protein n=1 Tax=Oleoguttula mirabilis TaxID=1507867 RepID=A0AAV9JPG1_9PEZI|nr:hypothetical protein LTR36_000939 [Oleoguttula mirabilis]
MTRTKAQAQTAQPGPSPDGAPPAGKRRAACDECRTKKLKCTGEQPHCSRCVREGIGCVYSAQKQMGRPKKKRQRTDDEEEMGAATDAQESHAAGRGSGRGAAQRPSASSWERMTVSAGMEVAGAGAGAGAGLLDDDSLSYFTPGGSLQPLPWLQPTGDDDWLMPHDHALPGLMTPDSSSSSNSPPTINLPPELLSTRHSHHHPQTKPDTSTHPLLLDPSLADDTNLGCPPSQTPLCACLSTLYLTLSTLQSPSPSATAFPTALAPLREAMQTARAVTACPHCPTAFLTALQNTHLLGTLLVSIAERFGTLVAAITAEARRADAADEMKRFRLADLDPGGGGGSASGASHPRATGTGGLGCAAAFSIELSPVEWRGMAKKVVRAEVHGPASSDDDDGGETCGPPYFTDLTRRMRERQERWHSGHNALPEDFPRDGEGRLIGGPRVPKGDHLCLKMIGYSEELLAGLDWT